MPDDRDRTIETVLSLIGKVFPIPGRFRSKLPADVAELSRLLTSARGERDGGYLNRPNFLSAYLRYFLPWNVFRLCWLFSLKADDGNGHGGYGGQGGQSILPALSDGDAITDLGSGPLTLPIALWIACPQLRSVKLEFRCVDRSVAVLEAGQKLFRELCGAAGGGAAASARGGKAAALRGISSRDGSDSPLDGRDDNAGCAWKIKTIHDSIDAPVRGKGAKLVTALNVFNEFFSGAQYGALERNAEKAAGILCKLCTEDGSVLVAEPGNPQGGAFISALRGALIAKGKFPAAPCTHGEVCPLPGTGAGRGTKAKWCHFAFDTDTAPQALRKLSAAAGIPKEKATLSFLLAGPAKPAELMAPPAATEPAARAKPTTAAGPGKSAAGALPRIRIISDTFPVPFERGGLGCYGCSERGMVLVTGKGRAARKGAHVCLAEPGTLIKLSLPAKEQRDPKTGALIVPLEG
jgi:hypothetical protein